MHLPSVVHTILRYLSLPAVPAYNAFASSPLPCSGRTSSWGIQIGQCVVSSPLARNTVSGCAGLLARVIMRYVHVCLLRLCKVLVIPQASTTAVGGLRCCYYFFLPEASRARARVFDFRRLDRLHTAVVSEQTASATARYDTARCPISRCCLCLGSIATCEKWALVIRLLRKSGSTLTEYRLSAAPYLILLGQHLIPRPAPLARTLFLSFDRPANSRVHFLCW